MQVKNVTVQDNGDVLFEHNGVRLVVHDCVVPELDVTEFNWAVQECRNGYGNGYGYELAVK